MRKRIIAIFILLVICFIQPNLSVNATTQKPLSFENAHDFLQDAFMAQVSLTMEFRTYEEVLEVLSSFFSDQFSQLFLNENLKQEKEGYIVWGSDFAPYFIPFFSYTEETKVVYDHIENKMYVYEFFKGNVEGPVSYEDHYEIVTIEYLEGNWVVTDLLFSETLPKNVIDAPPELILEVKETVKASKLEIEDPLPIYQLCGMSFKEQLLSGAIKGTY